MQTETANKKNLVKELLLVRANIEEMKSEIEKKEKQEKALIENLLNIMEAEGLKTFRIEGLASITAMKPRCYASVNKDNEEKLLDYLEKEGRYDMVRRTVHPSTLSSFVVQKLEANEQIPNFFNLYFKPNIKIIKE